MEVVYYSAHSVGNTQFTQKARGERVRDLIHHRTQTAELMDEEVDETLRHPPQAHTPVPIKAEELRSSHASS